MTRRKGYLAFQTLALAVSPKEGQERERAEEARPEGDESKWRIYFWTRFLR